ncbi:MAG: glycosyltransferase, partial [Bacilli bacterium]|nr:glycosyltransferase [Bacilli bacterium]
MENEIFVSVIMSTLNTNPDYLKEAIESILNQTYRNFEFIIISDGGNDDEILKLYTDDKRIKIIRHDVSLGLPKSLNEAINISKGKYIFRMDSDDISHVDRLAIQVAYMEKNPNIDIAATYYREIGASKRVVKEQCIYPNQVKCKLFFVNIIAHPSVVFRRESIFSKQLFYDESFRYSQDFELWTRSLNVEIAII